MSKYIIFDDAGLIQARYDTAIYQSIPSSAIRVPETLFRQTIRETDGIWKIHHATGEITKHPFPETPEPTLAEAKAAKLAEINSACDAILNRHISSYPSSEIRTFSQQTAEAQALIKDGDAPAPMLRDTARARGIDLKKLAKRVLVKHKALSLANAFVIGTRHALKDQLDLCMSIEEVEAIVVDIALPSPPAERKGNDELADTVSAMEMTIRLQEMQKAIEQFVSSTRPGKSQTRIGDCLNRAGEIASDLISPFLRKKNDDTSE